MIVSAAEMAGTRPDFFKLEWPGSAAGAGASATRSGRCPGRCSRRASASTSSSTACASSLVNGASGFIAGRAIWGEAVALTGDARMAFLGETAVPRLATLRTARGAGTPVARGRRLRRPAGAAGAARGGGEVVERGGAQDGAARQLDEGEESS